MVICIEPTNDCNLDCWYCFRKDRPVGYMDIEKYKILMKELPFTCRSVSLSFAGESGLHPKFSEFVDIAHKRGFTPLIASNGTLEYPSGIKIMKYPKPPTYICTNEFKFLKDYKLKPVYESCPQINFGTNVLWNGDVVPCCTDLGGKHIMGNVFEEGLMNVWNGKKYKELRKKTYCDGCEIYKYRMVEEKEKDEYTAISD